MTVNSLLKRNILSISFALLIAGALITGGCAQIENFLEGEPEVEAEEPTEELAEDEEEVKLLDQPEWYTDIRPFKVTDGYVHAAGSSVSQDSSRAKLQAEEMAKNRLVNGAVQVLEHLRKEVKENSDSSADLSGFIEIRYQLDKEELAAIAEQADKQVAFIEEPGQYQAYILYRLERDQLTDHLTEKIGSGELSWVVNQFDISELIADFVGTPQE